MTTVIAYLMLAISLLTVVRDNPSLPQPFKDQAIAIAAQALAQSSSLSAALVQVPLDSGLATTTKATTTPPVVDVAAAASVEATTTPKAPYVCPFQNDPSRSIYQDSQGRWFDTNTGDQVDPITKKCL